MFVNYVGLWSDMDIGPNRTKRCPDDRIHIPSGV